jgi:acetyltransferase-like isoleucine patch superfamily enzyme
MVTANLTKGKKCNISPDAYIGYREHGGKIILGNYVRIMHGCVLRTCTGIIEIGSYVSIGYYCIMHGMGGIKIGNHVLFSPGVHLYAQDHGISRNEIIMKQENISRPIEIGNDVWIGANSVICGDVKIGNGCVVGAGSVITKNIPDYEVWAGNPAKKIKERE